MSSRPQSSAITPNIKLCIICNQDGYGCHCGTTFHRSSLLPPPLAYTTKQPHLRDNPFDDGHALPDSPIQQVTHYVTDPDVAAPSIGGIPSTDSSDGLPSSIPSRHTKTISAPSSRTTSQEQIPTIPPQTQDNTGPRPAPLHLAPPSTQHHVLENSASITVDPFFRLLLPSPGSTARQAPKQKVTVIDPSTCRKSQMALVYGAGQPPPEGKSSRRVQEIVNPPTDGSPAGHKRRRSVTGQKQPIPLLSPSLIDEKQRLAAQKRDFFAVRDPEQHLSKEERVVRSSIRSLLSRLQNIPFKMIALIMLLFQLCLIISTVTIVIWIKDVKYKHVLKARIVAITIIAVAGCCTCVLVGYAQWLRLRQKTLAAKMSLETLDQGTRRNIAISWNEKTITLDDKRRTDSRLGMERKVRSLVSTAPSRSRIEDVERSPRLAHSHISSGQDALSSALRYQRQEHQPASQGARPELVQQDSANSALPSSNALPSRRISDGSYRARLESKLMGRGQLHRTSTNGGTSVNGSTINIEDIEQMIASEYGFISEDKSKQKMTTMGTGSEHEPAVAAPTLLPAIQETNSNESHHPPEPQIQPQTDVPTLTLNTPSSTSTVDLPSPFSPSEFPLPPTISMFPPPLAPRPQPPSSLLLPPANNQHRNNRPKSTPTLPSPPIQPLHFSISALTPTLAPASAPFSTTENFNPGLAAACWRGFSSNPNFGTWQLAILDRDWETMSAGGGGAWEKKTPGEEEWWMGVRRTDGKKVFSFSASSGSISASTSGSGSGTITAAAENGHGKGRNVNGSGFIIENPDGSRGGNDTEYADSLVRAHQNAQYLSPTATPTERGSIYSTTSSLIAAQQERSRAKVLLWQKLSLDFPLASPRLPPFPRPHPRIENHANPEGIAQQEGQTSGVGREEDGEMGQVQRIVTRLERNSGAGNRTGLGGLWSRRQKQRQRQNNRDRRRSVTRSVPTTEMKRQ